jgi:hypothetical protein
VTRASPVAENDHPPPPVPKHPNEMNANVHLRFGPSVSLHATARATPAGLVAIGLLVSAIILSVAPLVRIARERPR